MREEGSLGLQPLDQTQRVLEVRVCGMGLESQRIEEEDVHTLEQYTDWMKGLLTILSDAGYELKSIAADEERGNVIAFAVFHGTHTGEGGPVPPTGKTARADYVYVMEFEGERIRHMTKIWNDGISLTQLGWT